MTKVVNINALIGNMQLFTDPMMYCIKKLLVSMQAASLSEFYEVCKGLELARNFQFPVLREVIINAEVLCNSIISMLEVVVIFSSFLCSHHNLFLQLWMNILERHLRWLICQHSSWWVRFLNQEFKFRCYLKKNYMSLQVS